RRADSGPSPQARGQGYDAHLGRTHERDVVRHRRAARGARVRGRRAPGPRSRRRRDRAGRSGPSPHLEGRRQRAGAPAGGLEAGAGALQPGLRQALPRSRPTGQRGVRLRLSEGPFAGEARGHGGPVAQLEGFATAYVPAPPSGSFWRVFQYAAQGSALRPSSRVRRFASVKWSEVIRGESSSQASGTETVASGFARVEYAATLVAPRTLRR